MRCKNTCRWRSLLSGLLLCLTLPVSAAERELTFITIEVSPWATKHGDSGEMKGAFIELVREIERRTGIATSVSLTPFARVDRELESGGHDCTILIPRSEDAVVIGALVAYHDIGVIPRRGITLSTYEHLEPLTISLLRGSSITQRFDGDDSLTKVFDTDYLISLRKLSRSRVDAVAGAISTIRYLADHNQLSQYLGEPLVLDDVPLKFQCSKKSDKLDLMAEVNQAIEAMKADGVVERIKSEYYF
ncbi:substrate-binding periplasmic protein [Gilvimarinus algae]|uniref:Transporter substrate-binding domain-containing protein n=1 Tax=Gilvimarinus algae TaxID=3058037 RepID=A0ABT8TJ42_9GAMM|nr:transporter substrate-binding domain-containing protein [Gilvimarinus sp. SDUM040014]MDO3383098.1 transporter substrate-binding domain-containing protein [Gilvimarinus sp. SDUM040014]